MLELWKMTSSQKKILNFIKEIDKAKAIERKIYLFNKSKFEDNAQHSWHLSLMVWLFADSFEKKINLEKALKLALIHDLVEIYAGDTFSFDFEARKTKRAREEKAAKKLFKILPKELATEMNTLWYEYEDINSSEAEFVQALDKIQPIIQNILTKGITWKKFKITEQMVRDYKTHYNKNSHFLMDLFNNLLKEARKNKYTF